MKLCTAVALIGIGMICNSIGSAFNSWSIIQLKDRIAALEQKSQIQANDWKTGTMLLGCPAFNRADCVESFGRTAERN